MSALTVLEVAALLEKAIEAEEAVELALIERKPYSYYAFRFQRASRMRREANAWRAEVRSVFLSKFFAVN